MSDYSFENPINLPVKIADGCKGCGGLWGGVYAECATFKQSGTKFYEGQCLTCNRCLDCHESKWVKYSCAWQYQRKWGGRPERHRHDRLSREAYDRYASNPNILPTYRRIF